MAFKMNGWSAFTKEKNLPEEEQSRITEKGKNDTTIKTKLKTAIPMKGGSTTAGKILKGAITTANPGLSIVKGKVKFIKGLFNK